MLPVASSRLSGRMWLTVARLDPSIELAALPTRMASVEEDLNQLEKDIRQLKIEYEQYFGGGRSRPPSDVQWRVELVVKRYSDRGTEMNFAQRFRFNNLAMTYAKYHEIWRKRLKQKEEGVVQRHFGAAAREVEARRSQAEKREVYVMACADPTQEADKVEGLYRALVEARQNSGEAGEPPAIDTFRRFIEKKTKELKQQVGTDQVEYSVTLEDGQVKLKAKPKT